VVHDGKPVTGRCIGDGTEGGILRFRGVKPPIAAISDKDAAGCLAGRRPKNYGAGREAGCLDPAGDDDGVSDEAVTVVHVEDKRHVLPAVAEKYPSGAGCAGRIVNPTGQREMALLERLRVTRYPRAVSVQASEKAVEWGCDGHGRDLREKWIHGGSPHPGRRRRPDGARPGARLEAGAHQTGEYRSWSEAIDEVLADRHPLISPLTRTTPSKDNVTSMKKPLGSNAP